MPSRATREGPDTLLSAILPAPQRELRLPRSPPKLRTRSLDEGSRFAGRGSLRKINGGCGAGGDTNRRGVGGVRCAAYGCGMGARERKPSSSSHSWQPACLSVRGGCVGDCACVRACVCACVRGEVACARGPRQQLLGRAERAGREGREESGASDSHSAACG
jgi:hypothetical protein